MNFEWILCQEQPRKIEDLAMILIQEKSESAENLESTEKMTLRPVCLFIRLFIRDQILTFTTLFKSQCRVENLTIRPTKYPHEDFGDDLNSRTIGIRGKSGIHGKKTLRPVSFHKVSSFETKF